MDYEHINLLWWDSLCRKAFGKAIKLLQKENIKDLYYYRSLMFYFCTSLIQSEIDKIATILHLTFCIWSKDIMLCFNEISLASGVGLAPIKAQTITWNKFNEGYIWHIWAKINKLWNEKINWPMKGSMLLIMTNFFLSTSEMIYKLLTCVLLTVNILWKYINDIYNQHTFLNVFKTQAAKWSMIF